MRRHRLDLVMLFVLASGACAATSSLAVPACGASRPHLPAVPRSAPDARRRRRGVTAAAPRARRSELACALAERPEPAARVLATCEGRARGDALVGNATTCTRACSRTYARSPRRVSSARAAARPRHARPLVGAAPARPAGADRPLRSRHRPRRPARARRRSGEDVTMELAEVARARERRRRRGREGGRRQARRARAAAARAARRRPRAARGLPGPREDADGAVVRAGRARWTSRASSSRPT